MRIVIAGTGYVGLVTGVCLAFYGYNVTCVDTDKDKINLMKKGISPIFEEGLEALLNQSLDDGNISFETDFNKAYKDADVIFIAVGTPEKRDGSANLSYIYEVAEQIAYNVEKDCIIVIKSTVPIGTNDRVEAFIRSRLKHDVSIHVASNPEFLSQGTAVFDTMHASRIIIGVESPHAEKVLRELYKVFKDIPVLVTNRRSAEMIKYACNDFLALKISYINEIANLCELVGADIQDVAKGMGHDSRIGSKFLKAGIGYGGSCFPKDTKALHWLANFHDYEIKTVKAAIEINEQQKLKLIKKARKYYDSFNGLTVAVLGLTFKPDTDDLREAPSLVNIPMLLDDGATVKAWDPIGVANFKKAMEHNMECKADKIGYYNTIDETIENADICFIFTEWQDIANFNLDKYVKLMRKPIVLDGRNCYSLEAAKKASIIYESIGRSTVGLT